VRHLKLLWQESRDGETCRQAFKRLFGENWKYLDDIRSMERFRVECPEFSKKAEYHCPDGVVVWYSFDNGLISILKYVEVKTLWLEDDCTCNDPHHEHLSQAYLRLFGRGIVEPTKCKTHDCGDTIFYYLDDGVIVCSSYRGNSSILQEL